MKAEPLGDSALILRDLDRPAFEVADAIERARLPGVLEAVASYETVGVYYDPNVFMLSSLETVDFKIGKSTSAFHTIPVCYEMGEDLEDVARRLSMAPDEVVRLHSSTDYRCYAVGFCPGFPYLGYLPEELSGVPRRQSPRVRITPGSVAITGLQTGVYPLERPGGWAILGRTPLCIVDVESAYFPIKPGDVVRFEAISPPEFDAMFGRRL